MTFVLIGVIWHWTAGGKGVNDIEDDHYHYIVQPDGTVTKGDFDVEDNAPPLVPGQYAAHTLNANAGRASVAVDCMAGAVERPFNKGSNPVTWAAIDGMLDTTAMLLRKYRLKIDRRTTLSHAEVQPTLGIKQRNKWDITWLPDMKAPADPVAVGDRLRSMLLARM